MEKTLTKSIRSDMSAHDVALQWVTFLPEVIEDVRNAFIGLCMHAGKQVLAAVMEEYRT